MINFYRANNSTLLLLKLFIIISAELSAADLTSRPPIVPLGDATAVFNNLTVEKVTALKPRGTFKRKIENRAVIGETGRLEVKSQGEEITYGKMLPQGIQATKRLIQANHREAAQSKKVAKLEQRSLQSEKRATLRVDLSRSHFNPDFYLPTLAEEDPDTTDWVSTGFANPKLVTQEVESILDLYLSSADNTDFQITALFAWSVSTLVLIEKFYKELEGSFQDVYQNIEFSGEISKLNTLKKEAEFIINELGHPRQVESIKIMLAEKFIAKIDESVSARIKQRLKMDLHSAFTSYETGTLSQSGLHLILSFKIHSILYIYQRVLFEELLSLNSTGDLIFDGNFQIEFSTLMGNIIEEVSSQIGWINVDNLHAGNLAFVLGTQKNANPFFKNMARPIANALQSLK